VALRAMAALGLKFLKFAESHGIMNALLNFALIVDNNLFFPVIFV
jgi:hypothetical protein